MALGNEEINFCIPLENGYHCSPKTDQGSLNDWISAIIFNAVKPASSPL